MKVEISSIKIKVNKKTVTLTLDESKALFERLNLIFGPKYNYGYYYSPFNTLANGTSTFKTSDGALYGATSSIISNPLTAHSGLSTEIDLTNPTLQGEK